jgi:hypothetical protein
MDSKLRSAELQQSRHDYWRELTNFQNTTNKANKNKTPKATTYAKRLLEQLVNCAATTRLDTGSATKLEL